MENIKTESLVSKTWLLQPVAVTLMRHDYSLRQTVILESIVESLQPRLMEMINDHLPLKVVLRQEDIDSDGHLKIKILFNNLDSNKRRQLRDDLKMLESIPVEIPYKTSEGIRYLKTTNLCDVYFPKAKESDEFATLKIDMNEASRLFSLDLGYHRLCKEVVANCHHRSTQRIYMLLENYVSAGDFIIPTLEFQKMLRLENRYNHYSDFTKWVINPAMEELEAMAENGICDCYFTCQREYTKEKPDCDSDQLMFHIYRTNNNSENSDEMRRKAFVNLIERYFSIAPDKAVLLAKQINSDNYHNLVELLVDLKKQQEVSSDIKVDVLNRLTKFFEST